MKKLLAITAMLVCLCEVSHTQTATPPATVAETGPDVDVLHHLRRSTVSLGLRQTVNGKQRFATIGSGVIVAWHAT